MSFTALLIRAFAWDLDNAQTGVAIPAEIKTAPEPNSAVRRENLICIVIPIRIKIWINVLYFIGAAQREIPVLQVN